MTGEHSISQLCAIVGVSRSGYHRWLTSPVTERQREDAALATRIIASHRASRGNYVFRVTVFQERFFVINAARE